MKNGFFAKLAWMGIRKNKRLYVPYILTCIAMVAMLYIMLFLHFDGQLELLPVGGNSAVQMMDLQAGSLPYSPLFSYSIQILF